MNRTIWMITRYCVGPIGSIKKSVIDVYAERDSAIRRVHAEAPDAVDIDDTETMYQATMNDGSHVRAEEWTLADR